MSGCDCCGWADVYLVSVADLDSGLGAGAGVVY